MSISYPLFISGIFFVVPSFCRKLRHSQLYSPFSIFMSWKYWNHNTRSVHSYGSVGFPAWLSGKCAQRNWKLELVCALWIHVQQHWPIITSPIFCEFFRFLIIRKLYNSKYRWKIRVSWGTGKHSTCARWVRSFFGSLTIVIE